MAQVAEIPRDRWGRPVIDGVAHTRISTVAQTLEDSNGLIDWKVRLTVDGMVADADLRDGWARTDDNRAKRELAERALTLAGGRDAADTGTTIHDLLAEHAAGRSVPRLDPTTEARWQALREAISGLTWLSSEEFGVNREHTLAGSWDGIVSLPGDYTPRVVDLKTGRLHMRPVGIQLAAYAGCVPWTPEKGYGPSYDVAKDWGLVIHAPALGPVRLVRVDLERGARDLQTAMLLRALRKEKYAEDVVEIAADAVPVEQDEITVLIAGAATKDDCRALWATHAARWTTQHSQLVQLRFGN